LDYAKRLMRYLIGLSFIPTRYGWLESTAINQYIYHIHLIIKWHFENPTEIMIIHYFKILIFFKI